MNYIRYWQASGESLKTSIRTKTAWGSSQRRGIIPVEQFRSYRDG